MNFHDPAAPSTRHRNSMDTVVDTVIDTLEEDGCPKDHEPSRTQRGTPFRTSTGQNGSWLRDALGADHIVRRLNLLWQKNACG